MRLKTLGVVIVSLTSLLLSLGDDIFGGLNGVAILASSMHGTAAESGNEAANKGTNNDEHRSESGHHAMHKILATSPRVEDVVSTETYVCQIHSRRHIEIRALQEGYLQDVFVNEGQPVSEGDCMFQILPTLYQANLDSDLAEANLAEVEYANTKRLVEQRIVSEQELKLAQAKLDKAQAKVERAQAELEFASIKAPFDGIIDRLHEQKGSLLEEGAMLTTLCDNQVMWVYFNVPEVRYLEYQDVLSDQPNSDGLDIELKLANQRVFSAKGKIGAIEAEFNNETGNIAFRADFPNRDGLLRHGQTGTILIHRQSGDAIVIPQRATFEILARTYVYVIGEDNVVHQREIEIANEQDDIFVIADGLHGDEKIILEGHRQVRDGDIVQYEFRSPQDVMSNLKFHAE